jgi:type IV pilus assembly protein PilP
MKNNNLKIFLPISVCLLGFLGGCSYTDNYDDLSIWMKNEEKGMRGKIQPLPDVKKYQNISFTADKQNPFVMKLPLSMQELLKNKFAPDMKRRKEPLEDFSLDMLKMVGIVKKDGKTSALIKDRDGIIHYVSVGNYMGMNFGKIISLTENQIVLDERIREGDEWKSVNSTILLNVSSKEKRSMEKQNINYLDKS